MCIIKVTDEGGNRHTVRRDRSLINFSRINSSMGVSLGIITLLLYTGLLTILLVCVEKLNFIFSQTVITVSEEPLQQY